MKFILKTQNKFLRYFDGHMDIFVVFQNSHFFIPQLQKHCLNTFQALTAVMLKDKFLWDVTSEQECLFMKMEALRSFEISVTVQSTWCSISNDKKLHVTNVSFQILPQSPFGHYATLQNMSEEYLHVPQESIIRTFFFFFL